MKNFRLLLDPEKLRKLHRPFRDLLWSIPIKIGETVAQKKFQSVDRLIDTSKLFFYSGERGGNIPESSVTEIQMNILLKALEAVCEVKGEIAEIGSWRGVTTSNLARHTTKIIYAVDPHPFGAFPGVEEAFFAFEQRASASGNIHHIRECSGTAFKKCAEKQLSFVFIDAMHDFVSANFDFSIWSTILAKGGLIALHDVDDHPGVNLALQRALRRSDLQPWAYCPNLIVLKKLA